MVSLYSARDQAQGIVLTPRTCGSLSSWCGRPGSLGQVGRPSLPDAVGIKDPRCPSKPAPHRKKSQARPGRDDCSQCSPTPVFLYLPSHPSFLRLLSATFYITIATGSPYCGASRWPQSRHGVSLRAPHLLKGVLSRPHSTEDLVINELGAHRVLSGVMPRGEELLPEVDAPGGLALALSPLSGQLLTLGHSIHQMVRAAAQGPELRPEWGRGRRD